MSKYRDVRPSIADPGIRASMHPDHPAFAATLRLALIVFVLTLATRTAYLVVLQPHFGDWPDARHIEQIGWRLAQGQGYDHPGDNPPAIYRPPAMPMLIATVYKFVGRKPFVVQLVLATLSSLSVVALFYAACRLVRPKMGFLVALAAAVYPYFVFVAGTFYPEALGVFLLSLLALVFLLNVQRPRASVPGMLLLGGIVGLCGLCRPNWLITLPLAIPLVYVCRRLLHLESRPAPVFAALLAWGLVWSPWTIRNTFAYGHPIPVSASGGKNFYLGNKADARWNSKTAVSVPQEVIEREYELRNDPPALERYFYGLAWQYVRDNPLRCLGLWCGKLAHLWQPIPAIKDHKIAALKLVAAAVPYTLLLLAAVAGAVIAIRRRCWELLALLTLVVLDSALVAAFITPARLRIPFDVILLITAGLALAAAGWRKASGPTPLSGD